MGASPHLPHSTTQRGSAAFISCLSPTLPGLSLATGLLGGGSGLQLLQQGAPKFSPNPPILGSKLGAQGSWGEQVRLTQALPGSWPASAASSTPHLEGCGQPVPLCSFTPKDKE